MPFVLDRGKSQAEVLAVKMRENQPNFHGGFTAKEIKVGTQSSQDTGPNREKEAERSDPNIWWFPLPQDVFAEAKKPESKWDALFNFFKI